jgi:hypothetical protein
MLWLFFGLLLTGIILIIYGIYEERYQEIKNDVRVEYRFVPRTYYEEQLFDDQFKSKVSSVFNSDDEWYHRTSGRDMKIDRRNL